MEENQNYQGTSHVPNSKVNDAPEMPDNFLDGSRTPDGIFATVRYKGHYGLLCAQYQEFERHNISYKEAKEIARTAFDTCKHVIVFLDQDGNVIDEENGGIF